MTYGREPYPGIDKSEVFKKVTQEKYHMQTITTTPPSPEIGELMTRCWRVEPQSRPTFKDCFDVITSWLEKQGFTTKQSQPYNSTPIALNTAGSIRSSAVEDYQNMGDKKHVSNDYQTVANNRNSDYLTTTNEKNEIDQSNYANRGQSNKV